RAMRSRRHYPRRWMWLAAIGCVASGCGASHRAGRGATEGIITELQRQRAEAEAKNGETPMEQIARSAVRGTLTELGDPRRQQELAMLTRAATQGVLASLGMVEQRQAWGGG